MIAAATTIPTISSAIEAAIPSLSQNSAPVKTGRLRIKALEVKASVPIQETTLDIATLTTLLQDASLSNTHLPDAIKTRIPALSDRLTKLRVHAKILSTNTNDVLEHEAVLAIAAKFKILPEHKQALTSFKAHHKILVTSTLNSLLVSSTGGDLEDDEDLVEDFKTRLTSYSVRKLAGCTDMLETDFAGLPPGDVRRVLKCFHNIGKEAVAKALAAVTHFEAESTVSISRVREAWEDDDVLITGTFDEGKPLSGPSPVNMWSDPNPPSSVTSEEWESTRNALYAKGKEGSDPSAKGSAENLTYRAALSLNLMQHRYKTDLFVVGGQGRLLVERALGILVPKSVFDAAQEVSGKEYFTTADKLKVYGKQSGSNKDVKDAMYELNTFGNRTDHDEMPDLKPEEKPDVIKYALIVAKAVLAKLDVEKCAIM